MPELVCEQCCNNPVHVNGLDLKMYFLFIRVRRNLDRLDNIQNRLGLVKLLRPYLELSWASVVKVKSS